MAEVYPSDSELLNLEAEAETGVEYIATGQSPYYLQFRKMLYRLLLAARRSNDLRVFDEGGLDIGVKAGSFYTGTQLVSYAGSSGNLLADDKAAIYVSLDADGKLVTDEYAGFPDMAEAAHVRLGIVTTANGDITSIDDCRGEHMFAIPHEAGGAAQRIEAHTGDGTLVEYESSSVHTNRGATGVVTLTLPDSALQGTVFTFCVQEAQELRVEPGSTAIRDDSGQTADKYKSASAIGACLKVVADANGDWVVTAKNGTWTEEA
jgi:hypothetical protein